MEKNDLRFSGNERALPFSAHLPPVEFPVASCHATSEEGLADADPEGCVDPRCTWHLPGQKHVALGSCSSGPPV